jgi:hypothetical protein
MLIENGLIKGLGISGTANVDKYFYDYEHTVNHLILGENNFDEIILSSTKYQKILLLGFKSLNRGVKYGKINETRIKNNLEYTIDNFDLIGRPSKIIDVKLNYISFDNLAIEQLKLRELVDEEEFKNRYMGNDGKFSLFVDAVQDSWSISSLGERTKFKDEETIIDVFKNINN